MIATQSQQFMSPYMFMGLNKESRILFRHSVMGLTGKQRAIAILNIVSKALSIESELLLSRTRKEEVVAARMICYFEIKRQTKLTLNQIGDIFGRDHSTVIHALEKYEDDYKLSKDFRALVAVYKRFLSNI